MIIRGGVREEVSLKFYRWAVRFESVRTPRKRV